MPTPYPHHAAHYIARVASVLLCTVFITGCMTMPGARPLHPGEHQVGVSLGGPIVKFGDANVPLPGAVLEGRSGLTYLANKPVDLNYGINATAIGFGIAQLHLGASWLMLDQDGARPALSVTNRLFVGTNALTPQDKAPGTKQAWGADQLEVSASYLLGQQLVYLSIAQYTDFGLPDLLLTPALGAMFDFGELNGFKLMLEARYYAINKKKSLTTVEWSSAPRGGLGVGVGFSYAFGQRGCSCAVTR